MTATSLLPDAARAAGMSFAELCTKLISYAFREVNGYLSRILNPFVREMDFTFKFRIERNPSLRGAVQNAAKGFFYGDVSRETSPDAYSAVG